MVQVGTCSPTVSKKTPKTTDLCCVCDKTVGKNVKAIQCNSCDRWVHLRCDGTVDPEAFKGLTEHPSPAILYLCPPCMKPWGLVRLMSSTPCQTQSTQTQATGTSNKGVSVKLDKSATPGPKTKTKSVGVSTSPSNEKQNKQGDGDPLTQAIPSEVGKTSTLNAGVLLTSIPSTSRQGKPNTLDKQKTLDKKKNQPKPKPTKTSDKSVGTPKELPNLARPNSLIIFGASESSSPLLEDREKFDRQIWSDLCQKIEMGRVEPILIQRLAGEPRENSTRPIRVEVSDPEIAERAILLSRGLGQIYIRPDLPKSIRVAKKSKQEFQASQIVIRGVPESNESLSNEMNDCRQWSYISTKLMIPGLVARDIARLPRPTHLNSLSQPRLLRVTLASPEMASKVLECWRDVRPRLPPNIIIHCSKSREERLTARKHSAPTPASPLLLMPRLESMVPPSPSKNDLEPVP